MKNLPHFIFLSACLISNIVFGANGIIPGTGIETDPYLIEDVNDFHAFCGDSAYWDDYIRLDSDLNLADVAYASAPIAPTSSDQFIGYFDGNGHVISNLTISGGWYIGLFGYLGENGYVTSLGLDSPNITTTGNYNGSMVGLITSGQVTQCYAVNVNITGSEQIGGLCGRLTSSSSVTNCYTTGTISGSGHTGGFCGYSHSSTISNCYSNCQVTGGPSTNGFLGTSYYGTTSNVYYYQYGTYGSGAGIGLDDVQMRDQGYYTGFDFVSTWSIVSGHCPKLSYQTDDGPLPFGQTLSTTLAGSGTSDDPYLITDYDDLMEFGGNSALRSGCYELTADIDLGGLTLSTSFVPERFVGRFEGNGCAISNFSISTTSSYIGFFNRIEGSVSNLGIESATITSTGIYIGSLVGYMYYGNVDKCYALDVQVSGHEQTGGLCGRNSYGSITDSYASGAVTGNSAHIGGFCGYNYSGTITNCYSNCFVIGTTSVGGFLGTNYSGTVSNAYFHKYCGRDNGIGTGLDDVQISDQAYFSGFDFASTWTIVSGYCPKLSYQVSDGPLPIPLTISTSLAGSGTSDDPFLIADYDDLIEFSDNSALRYGCYELTADIDLDGLTLTDSLVPERFIGTFEGNGHVISNLTINSTSSYVGLFRQLDGSISNLGLESAIVTSAGNYVGTLVGEVYFGQVQQCYSTGVQVTGNERTGALFGQTNNSTVTDCYGTGTVTGSGSHIGGLCGYNYYSTITNAYTNCQVIGSTSIGGIVGTNSSGSISNTYCYEYGTRNNGAGTALNDPEMLSEASYSGFDFVTTWSIVSGHCPKLSYQISDGPVSLGLTLSTTLAGSGTSNDPYQIADYNDLMEFCDNAALSSCCYELVDDIDLGGETWSESLITRRFMGLLEGNGHVISNFNINSTFSYAGFIDSLDGIVSRVGFETVNITTTGSYAGVLTGQNYYGQIYECYASDIQITGNEQIGGLCGRNTTGVISDCYATESTINGNRHTGGLCGYNYYSTISNSFSNCLVVCPADAGGLLGTIYGGTIANCFWDTDTSGQTTSAGGTGLATVDMQTLTTYTDAGWVFVPDEPLGLWYMFAGEYPQLAWEVVVVPDVVGMTYADAEAEIIDSGLQVGDLTYEYSFTVASGSVISQGATAGDDISHRTPLDLVISKGPEMTIVPDVVDLTQSAAEAALTGAKLVSSATTDYSMTVPEGSVISQSIPAGETIIINRVVDIVVSAGPEMATVPDVSGMTETEAILALHAVKLEAGTITHEYNETVDSGDVISQSVSAGSSVVINTTVDLSVSDGPEMVGVPSLYDMNLVSAEAEIVNAGLIVGTISYAYSFTVADGNVLAQSVAGGGTAVIGSAVDLVVSQGPQIVTVPDVAGMAQAAAEAAIVAEGLLVGDVTLEYSATIASGIVLSQGVDAGSDILIGSFVNLAVSKGPEMTTVPSVVGLEEDYAEVTLVAADLVVGTVTYNYSFSVDAGIVIIQSLVGGTAAAVDTEVDLIVSAGPEMTTVPNVIELTEAYATTLLEDANLIVGDITSEYSLTVPAGCVISQSVDPNEVVVIYTVVDLVVSDGATVTVPDVEGMEQALAESAIVSAALTVGTITTEYSSTVPAGYVISQSVAAGVSVTFNTAVDLVISDGIEMVTVPDVGGMTDVDAESALIAAGLTVGASSYEMSYTVVLDNVVSQSVASGTVVAIGTSVDLVLSSGSDFIDLTEFALVSANWEAVGCISGADCNQVDFNADGVVDLQDVLLLSQGWLSSDGIDVPNTIADYLETGDFADIGWQFGGSGDWAVASDESYRGLYSAKSGVVSDDESSDLILTVDTTGYSMISFACKVSSEEDYDYLKFYIDGKRQDSFSGEMGWTTNSYSLTPGIHTFKWTYVKDSSISEGSDCAWIDDIVIY